ncbi:hypothetical protein DH2020_033052 [Rehmannia glutinosa]|uniref:Tropinone reductase-like 3 n=1 Tax=Rehmannia glutinosa TaxID=99300 RepID=A0ABR0VFU4_REHGL
MLGAGGGGVLGGRVAIPSIYRERKRNQINGEDREKIRRKVAIVTASTQGIGFGIAERLGLEGAAVVISSRRQKNVDEAAEKLRVKGIEVLGLVCHVSNAQQRKDLIEKTVAKYGKIDVIVCNAAANPAVDGILETKESVLDKLWEINVKTSVLLLQEAAPHLQKGSSVIFVSSIAAYQPPQGLAMYGVTKTALLGLTKKSLEEKTLLNRLGTTQDMAAATAYLASDDASYVTGETLVVAEECNLDSNFVLWCCGATVNEVRHDPISTYDISHFGGCPE